ncbi:hypothetical protein ACHQM5_003895 [Ranunculus cassubicifolius]
MEKSSAHHLFRPSSIEKTTGEPNSGEHEMKAATTPKTKVRKNGKLSNQQGRKVTQRGVGVAQLERLRLQERWKFMTEMDPVTPPSSILQHPLQFQSPVPYFDPKTRPLPVSLNRGGGRLFSDPSHVHYEGDDFNGGGFSFYRYSNGGFGSDSVRSLSVGSNGGFEMKHGGEEPQRFQTLNQVVEQPAKELSSIQMTHCLSEKCGFCFKKKRQTPEMIGFKQMNGFDSLGLSLGSPRSFDGNVKTFGLNTEEVVEVKAVHRKKNAVRGESVFMEYEFFPSSSTSSNSCSGSGSNKDSSVSEGMGGGSGSVSPTTPTAHFLDLSLKLC